MEVGNDYYIVKFKFDYNYSKVVHEGPWFVGTKILCKKCRMQKDCLMDKAFGFTS